MISWLLALALAQDPSSSLDAWKEGKPTLARRLAEEELRADPSDVQARVVAAVEYVFLFTLAAGLVVLYAAIQATQDERRFESAVVRTLGARRAVVRESLLAEFATLGLLAGLLAATAAGCETTMALRIPARPHWAMISAMVRGAVVMIARSTGAPADSMSGTQGWPSSVVWRGLTASNWPR